MSIEDRVMRKVYEKPERELSLHTGRQIMLFRLVDYLLLLQEVIRSYVSGYRLITWLKSIKLVTMFFTLNDDSGSFTKSV